MFSEKAALIWAAGTFRCHRQSVFVDTASSRSRGRHWEINAYLNSNTIVLEIYWRKMRGLGHFIALLFFPMTFCVDFHVEPGSYNAHRVYVKSPVAVRSLIGTESDADISRIHSHIQKRSTDVLDSCNGLKEFETKLTSNTHNVSSLEAPMQPRGSASKPRDLYLILIMYLQ